MKLFQRPVSRSRSVGFRGLGPWVLMAAVGMVMGCAERGYEGAAVAPWPQKDMSEIVTEGRSFKARPGNVQDLAQFEEFVASRPTPALFRKVYPDVTLILPGDIATREFRTDRSRYFADIDLEGRIVSGGFQ